MWLPITVFLLMALLLADIAILNYLLKVQRDMEKLKRLLYADARLSLNISQKLRRYNHRIPADDQPTNKATLVARSKRPGGSQENE